MRFTQAARRQGKSLAQRLETLELVAQAKGTAREIDFVWIDELDDLLEMVASRADRKSRLDYIERYR